MLSGNKNGIAVAITLLVVLFILWLIFGRTTEHIWSSILFFLCFVATIVIITNDWINHLRNQLFDGSLAATIFVFTIFFILANVEMGYWGTTTQLWFNILSIIRWIIVVVYGGLLLFTIIRTIQENF